MRETADNVEMQGIEFQIINDSDAASNGIEKLAKSLERLKTSLGTGGSSISRLSSGIKRLRENLDGLDTTNMGTKLKGISDALASLNVSDTAKISPSLPKNIAALNTAVAEADVEKLNTFANGLSSLQSSTVNLKVSSSIGHQLREIGTAIDEIKWTDGDKMSALADGLRPLGELGRASLTSFITQFGKLPEVITALDGVDIEQFATQMERLAAAMKPFADEMQKVSSGFSAFPSRIQRLVTSTAQYNGAVRAATSNTSGWGRALKTISFVAVFRKTSQWLGSAITKANEYIETLNMFTVTMGAYGEEAYNYAQTVSEVMGIDPQAWMQNQGVFNSIITGFGVAEDKAAAMSKNLTQLGYDLASFYDITVEAAMQKVQAGISGELEPLRRLGYDLSLARLEQERLNLGITKSVSEMTQAEKAQLRYYAMLTQVTEAQGDMARTLDEPANQLRVLKAQLTQASRAVGNLFIPVLNKVLPVATAVVSALREIVNEIGALLGIQMADEVDWGDGEDATAAISANISDASDSAKKMKSYLMGFDELNVINPNDSSSTDTGTGSSFDLDVLEYDFLSGAVTERIDEIKAKLEPFVTWVKENLNSILWIVEAVGVTIAAWKIGNGAITLFSSLSKLSVAQLSPVLSVAIALGGAFLFFKNLVDAIENGVDWDNFIGMIAGAAIAAGALGLAFGSAVGVLVGGISLIAIGAVTLASGFDEIISTGELTTETFWLMAAGIAAMGVGFALVTGSWIPLVVAAIAGVALAVYKNWDSIKEDLSGAWEWISDTWDKLGEGAKTAGAAIETAFTGAFTAIGILAKSILNGIIGGIEDFINNVIGGINGLIGGFNKVATWAGEVLGTGWSGISLISTVKLPRLYASGGFPEMGELFIANEAGPELVGNIGRRTAVVNNDQIVASVAGGVAGGVAEANEQQNALLREQNELLRAILAKDTGIKLDGKTLLRSTEKAARQRGAVIMAGGVTG